MVVVMVVCLWECAQASIYVRVCVFDGVHILLNLRTQPVSDTELQGPSSAAFPL